MGGYANRVIRLDFPDLAEEGDEIWVMIRNPKVMPPGELARRNVKTLENGEFDTDDAMEASYEIFAKLVIGWHVYDAMDPDDNQAPLGMPANARSVAKLPLEILNRMGQELSKLNPQMPTGSQEATTSTS